MKRCPKIGDRVRCAATCIHGAFTGTVHAIYPNREWDEEREQEGALLPERLWQVGVTVDAIPEPWPYPSTNRIAPTVKDLQPID